MADTWHVTRQVQRSVLQPGGGFGDVITVYFDTPHGYSGSVDVPLAMFTADEVRKRVDARVAVLDEVHNL
jgi:hypothetical protein